MTALCIAGEACSQKVEMAIAKKSHCVKCKALLQGLTPFAVHLVRVLEKKR